MSSRFLITDQLILPHDAREHVTWYALRGWFWSERQLPPVGAQAVIHMDGIHVQSVSMGEQQQRHGIWTTRHGAPHGSTRCRECASRKKFSEEWRSGAIHGWWRLARRSGLLLLHLLALATVGIAGCAHLCHITNNALHHSADTGDKENEADPVVPYIRCEHVHKRSEYVRVGAI